MNALAAEKTESSLQSSAKEFEEFLYIVSHDLAAPTRHIREFSRLLLESLPPETRVENGEFERFLTGALDKLEAMQDALLAYSRVTTRAEPFQRIAAKDLTEEAMTLLQPKIRESGVQIDIGELPEVYGDTRQLMMVFYHTLDNAIKFRKKNAAANISISAQKKQDDIIFTIADDGIGVEEKFYDEIFKIFRKLHPASEYPGAGAGLSIARKIIERHGGRIWIESVLYRGTSVKFALPAIRA